MKIKKNGKTDEGYVFVQKNGKIAFLDMDSPVVLGEGLNDVELPDELFGLVKSFPKFDIVDFQINATHWKSNPDEVLDILYLTLDNKIYDNIFVWDQDINMTEREKLPEKETTTITRNHVTNLLREKVAQELVYVEKHDAWLLPKTGQYLLGNKWDVINNIKNEDTICIIHTTPLVISVKKYLKGKQKEKNEILENATEYVFQV